MKRSARNNEERGVALVTTMIVVAVLAVVAVAFMQSTGMDRLSSRTAVGYAQARFAAMAGASAAESAVVWAIATYPDSATVWQNIGGGSTNEATVLYVRAAATNTNAGARPGQFGEDIRLLALPLVSGGTVVPLGSIGAAMPYVSSDTNMIDLNATNQSYTDPFVGRRSPTNASPQLMAQPVTAARWVYVTKFPGPVNATNPYVARYAYWVEDESFRLNINVATNGERGNSTNGLSDEERFFFERSGPDQLRVDGSWGSFGNNALKNANYAGAIDGREDASYASAATAAFGAGVSDPAALPELRFLTTAYSAGLDLTRGGVKRFNLNTMTNGVSGPTATNQIRTSLDRFISAITNTNAAPLFGQRFYREPEWWRLSTNVIHANQTNFVSTNTNTPGTNHALIYLNKIAANVLDYIDDNSQPTLLNTDVGYTVRAGKPSTALEPLGGGIEGTNPVIAWGTENLPRLFGYALHARLVKMDPIGYATNAPPANPRAQFEFTLDHYLAFWNPGTRAVVFGNGVDNGGTNYVGEAFFVIADQPGWGSGLVPEGDPDRDFTNSLPSGALFPAGAVTLLTTAPLAEARKVVPSAGTIVSVPIADSLRRYSGVTTRVDSDTNSPPYANLQRKYAVGLDQRDGPSLDARTEFLLGNESGYLETFGALTVGTMRLWVTNGGMTNSDTNFLSYSTLRGNVTNTNPSAVIRVMPGPPRSTEGDPRALNEQIELKTYITGTANSDQTRFFTQSNFTQIGAANTTYVDPSAWADVSSISPGAVNAPLIVRDAGMRSIGELGHIVDPVRARGTNGTAGVGTTNIVFARGGGRTLRIGHPEVFHTNTNRAGLWWDGNTNTNSWWVGNQTNASRTWTAWRLADIFTANANTNFPASDTNAALRALQVPGLINPNGMLRDNGAALRAALFGFRFLDSPDGGLASANRPLTNATQIATIISNYGFRLTNTNSWTPAGAVNPMWERGEISEFPFLAAGTTFGFNMSNNFDRGREELVRRSIEMMTTRGSIFSVYVVGQALNGTNVVGTVRLKRTFEINPQFATADALRDDFNPAQAARVARRFASPTNYTTRILSSFYD